MTEIIRSASISGVRQVGGRISPANKTAVQVQTEEERNNDKTFLDTTKKDSIEIKAEFGNHPRVEQETSAESQTANAIEESVVRSDDWQRQVLSSLQLERDELREDNAQLAEKLSELQEKHNELLDNVKDAVEEKSQEGFKQGYSEGIESAKEQVDEQLKESQQLMEMFSQAVKQKLKNVDGLSVEIGFTALIKLVGEHLGDKKFSKAYIMTAVEQVRSETQLDVHISPNDYQMLTKYDELSQISKALPNVSFVEDSRVGLGGCVIDSNHGSWDARIEAQLHRLKDALKIANEHSD